MLGLHLRARVRTADPVEYQQAKQYAKENRADHKANLPYVGLHGLVAREPTIFTAEFPDKAWRKQCLRCLLVFGSCPSIRSGSPNGLEAAQGTTFSDVSTLLLARHWQRLYLRVGSESLPLRPDLR